MPRVPAPPALKLLNGRREGYDSGGRKVNEGPGFKRAPLGPPPEDLGDKGRAVWETTAAELDRLELSKPLDREALAMYCLAVQRAWEAQADIDENGLTETGAKGGRIKNPAVTVLEQCSREIRMWAQEFGFTPSAEGRIQAQAAEPSDEDNPYAEGGESVTG